MAKSSTRRYIEATRAGLIQLRRARETGLLIGVYKNDEAGLSPEGEYSTVCETHGEVITHETRKLALLHASNPTGWCEACMDKFLPRRP